MPLVVPNTIMALPTLSSFEACADFSKTVLPYLPQLSALPQQILASYNDIDALKELYIATNPLISTAALAIALTPFIWLASEINKNYSQVDRLWSILPTVFVGNYTLYAHAIGLEDTERMDTLLVAYTIWSARLTFNYWRKGGYSIGSEDYRWMIVKGYVNNEAIWKVFNLTFIAIAQMVLLFLISCPAYILLLSTKQGMAMHTVDTVASRLIVGLVLLEFMADQQQWDFQKAKKIHQLTGKAPVGFETSDLKRGFIVSGLWTWCRHPNFACEQAIWFVLYQWSCLITDQLYNWSGVGAVGYLILFQASTWLTELITAGKYPEYKEYQQRVNKFVPRWSSALPDDVVESVEGVAGKVEGGLKKEIEKKNKKRN